MIFILFGKDLIEIICPIEYMKYFNSTTNIYFIILGLIHYFNSITHWFVLSKGTKETFVSYIKSILFLLLVVILILLIFYNSLSFIIENIIFYVIILMIFKLMINITLLRKIY